MALQALAARPKSIPSANTPLGDVRAVGSRTKSRTRAPARARSANSLCSPASSAMNMPEWTRTPISCSAWLKKRPRASLVTAQRPKTSGHRCDSSTLRKRRRAHRTAKLLPGRSGFARLLYDAPTCPRCGSRLSSSLIVLVLHIVPVSQEFVHCGRCYHLVGAVRAATRNNQPTGQTDQIWRH
jgi:hypothetical protein